VNSVSNGHHSATVLVVLRRRGRKDHGVRSIVSDVIHRVDGIFGVSRFIFGVSRSSSVSSRFIFGTTLPGLWVRNV
jgi:hypothetical protein